MLDANDLSNMLSNADEGTILVLEYKAGLPPTQRAKREFAEAWDWNRPPTKYVGHFGGLKTNKWGETYLLLWVHNRGQTGSWRSFNPKLGTLLSLKRVN